MLLLDGEFISKLILKHNFSLPVRSKMRVFHGVVAFVCDFIAPFIYRAIRQLPQRLWVVQTRHKLREASVVDGGMKGCKNPFLYGVLLRS